MTNRGSIIIAVAAVFTLLGVALFIRTIRYKRLRLTEVIAMNPSPRVLADILCGRMRYGEDYQDYTPPAVAWKRGMGDCEEFATIALMVLKANNRRAILGWATFEDNSPHVMCCVYDAGRWATIDEGGYKCGWAETPQQAVRHACPTAVKVYLSTSPPAQ